MVGVNFKVTLPWSVPSFSYFGISNLIEGNTRMSSDFLKEGTVVELGTFSKEENNGFEE